jgi:hypothetical protein
MGEASSPAALPAPVPQPPNPLMLPPPFPHGPPLVVDAPPPLNGALFFDLVPTDPGLESVPLPTTSPPATLVADPTLGMLGAPLMLIAPPPGRRQTCG